jgi:hypothetical protein
MNQVQFALPVRRFGATSRRDAWWTQPLVVAVGLGIAVAYMTWAAFQGAYYAHLGYLSPLYSPELLGDSPHAWFGPAPTWWPEFLPFAFSPAFLILWAPGGFRLTCYYYRGAYYKAFWADPPSCAVGEPRSRYLGENSFPLIMRNAHRYFLYLALIFIVLLAYDVWNGMWFPVGAGDAVEFGLGVGTLVLALNVTLLSGYIFGCHSLRHLVGGRDDCLTQSTSKTAYDCVSCLNRRHMLFAWLSLVWVSFSDLYVRLCAMGIWTDFRII